ncbi:colipase-like protein 2 isoform X1 [Dasypus novemcinctus]|uniref:colipase-like protein 2 isoform X1 n=1 Tax=Dasypus novemcinctus TaxID=9361 RepID=UPI00265FF43C|nr:colipase-like protein 2 isoform X1 [Dasypus novemcinctus]
MAAALLLLAGLLLPAGRLSPQFGSARKVNGVKCSHHAECRSDCCLVDLDSGGSSCAPKAKIRWACLPQLLHILQDSAPATSSEKPSPRQLPLPWLMPPSGHESPSFAMASVFLSPWSELFKGRGYITFITPAWRPHIGGAQQMPVG